MSLISSLPNSRTRKGFTLIDLLTVALMLMILMALSLPLFHSAVKGAKPPAGRPAVAVPAASLQTASAKRGKMVIAGRFMPGIATLATASGIPNSNRAH